MKLIIACDFNSVEQLNRFLAYFPNTQLVLKVGWELILSTSLSVLRRLQRYGHRIMLDLKLHDIPNTIVKSIAVIKSFQPDFITINLGAGAASVRTAIQACAQSNTQVIGVSYLTSMADTVIQQVNNNHRSLKANLANLVNWGWQWGVRNFVCASSEAIWVKKLHPDATTFCPGITLRTNDQVRISSGADVAMIDYLIVGRAIINSRNPAAVYRQLLTGQGLVMMI